MAVYYHHTIFRLNEELIPMNRTPHLYLKKQVATIGNRKMPLFDQTLRRNKNPLRPHPLPDVINESR